MIKVRPPFWIILVIVAAFALFQYFVGNRFSFMSHRHVYDYAGFLPQQDLPRFDWYMDLIMQESDIDIRFVFVKGTNGESIEELAVDWMEKLRIGEKTGKERGLLLLYDTKGQCLKVEVGYGLEEYFPDGFIGYLINRHARLFFESGDKSLGLRLLLRILQYRIREEVLGNSFDPRVLDVIGNYGDLSGGAGVTATMQTQNGHQKNIRPRFNEAERTRYTAKDSPVDTYTSYLQWLSQPVYDPNIDLFTERSRQYLSSLSMSPAYFDFILLGEYGHHYKVVERQNLAILYYTTSPFISPHLFVKENNKWRMDIVAEVLNTKEVTGGYYTWTYMGKNDSYSQTFYDLLVTVKGYGRFKDGDNRPLVVRGSKTL